MNFPDYLISDPKIIQEQAELLKFYEHLEKSKQASEKKDNFWEMKENFGEKKNNNKITNEGELYQASQISQASSRLAVEKKKMEANLKLASERDKRLREAETREKMLQEASAYNPLYSQDIFEEEDINLDNKGNYDHLIQHLICFDYKLARERKTLKSGEFERVPDKFSSAGQYRHIFQKLFFKECTESIKNSLLDLQKHNQWPDTAPLKLKIVNDNAGHGDFVYFDASHQKKKENGNNLEQQLFDLTFSKNYIVLISSERKFDLELLEDRDFKNKTKFCFLAFMSNEERKPGTSFPKLKSMMNLHNFKFRFVKSESIDIFLHPVLKITTFIREFLGLKALQVSELSPMIYNPKLSSDVIRVSDPSVVINYFEKIENNFNVTQLKSIKEICLTSEGISLLQGPPGTGKTFTLMGIVSGIYHYIKNSPGAFRRHIMICAPSNAAIDEIITRIVRYGLLDEEGKPQRVRVVRIGVLDKNPSDTVKSVCLENLAQNELFLQNSQFMLAENKSTIQIKDEIDKINKQIEEARKDPDTSKTLLDGMYEKRRTLVGVYTDIKQNKALMREKYNEIMKRLLSTADIICCTLGSAGSEKLELFKNNIEAVIVDEASQCSEVTNIIPLQYSVKRFILIGDPKQLMATTYSSDANETKYNRSLFERFIDNGVKPFFLDIQYRMHPNVRQFPSKTFYDDRLQDSDSVLRREFPSYLKCFEKINNLFIDLPFSEEKMVDYSFMNVDEAKIAVSIVKKLLKNLPSTSKSANNIGFISPYKRQTRYFQELINKELEGNYSKCVQINTVDSFQGQEKDIIIFSTVRSSTKSETLSPSNLIGFLNDERRMNVAITRARFVLIVIGNSKTLATNPIWRRLIYHMENDKMFSKFDSIEDFEEASGIIFTHGYIPSSKLPSRLLLPKLSLMNRIKLPQKHSSPNPESFYESTEKKRV